MSDKKVVVIADEKSISFLYKEVLERTFGSQVEIHCFISPAEALEKLNSLSQADLLLTGRFSFRGGTNGLDLALAYKERFPEGKLIIASGYDDPAVFKGVNYDHFLLRNAKVVEIERVMKKLLQIS